MRILVLGGGVVGVTAAWYLAQDGHDVTLIDRQAGPALETSRANGGQISAAHAEPWANPRAPLTVLRWLGREDAPLLFRLHADAAQWRWGLAFLRECLPQRHRRNTVQLVNLARYSRQCLGELRAATGIAYDEQLRGILEFHTDRAAFDAACATAAHVRSLGIERVPQTPRQCVAIDPALAAIEPKLAGGILTPTDESGDAHVFTRELAQRAGSLGVRFLWNTTVDALDVEGDRVARARCTAGGGARAITADAYVVALASYSGRLVQPLGVACPVYPVKGYSATIDIGTHGGAPTVSMTDPEYKMVFSRLGSRLRVAGTAELDGWSTDLNAVRCEMLLQRTFEVFPDAGERASAQLWTGLRPATPSNVPLVGRTRYRNLYLDTGHGTLGWTLACGSGRALSDIVSGRAPGCEFCFLSPDDR